MSYPSGNNVPRTTKDWIVYAEQRGRALGRTAYGGNIEKLAAARFKFEPLARDAFIAAYRSAKEKPHDGH